MARERDDWHDDRPTLGDFLAHMPDWVFQPPRPAVDPRAVLLDEAVVVYDGETPEQWRARRCAYLEVPRYSAATRAFWRAMRAEERRRWPVEPLYAGTNEDRPAPE